MFGQTWRCSACGVRYRCAANAVQPGERPGRYTDTRDAGAPNGPNTLPSLLGRALAPVPVLGHDVNNRHVTGPNERYM
ncbi:hypothetical protein GCM10010341_64080 [Streptomyces noursei]|nr:hypothetical protein GCM10010341_64080 [Streptomyces noursei]